MATNAPAARKVGPLINRNYGFLWFGQAISLVGDQVFDLTLVVWIASIIARQPDGSIAPWAPLAVSGVLVAATLPFFLVGPLAGVFVDRWNKRATLLRMDAARTVLILLLLLATGIVPLPFFAGGQPTIPFQLGLIYGVVFLASTCAQFFGPARLALIGDVVADEYRAQASSLAQGSQALAIIIGPPLAAPLLFSFGVQWALLVNAASFLVSFLCVNVVRAPQAARSVEVGARGNVGREFRDGLRFAFTNRIISTILGIAFIAALGAGAFNALLVFFVTENLHTPVTNVGIMGAVFGLGAIIGAIIAGTIAQKMGVERLLIGSIFAAAAVFFVLARMTSFGPALVLTFLAGVIQVALNISLTPLLLRATPRAMIGRVAAVLNPSGQVAQLISVGLAGYLASTVLRNFHQSVDVGSLHLFTLGPIDTILTGSAVFFLLSAIFAAVRLRGGAPVAPVPEPAVIPVAAETAASAGE